MVQYPDCPHCGNASTSMSIVDVVFGGVHLKGVQCNNPECNRYLGFFKDYDGILNELIDAIDEVKSDIDNLESELNRNR